MDAWIGTSDRIVPETYRTVTGRAAYTAWATAWAVGQPDDNGGPEYCIVLFGDLMHDDGCEVVNDFVCEYDGLPPDRTAF